MGCVLLNFVESENLFARITLSHWAVVDQFDVEDTISSGHLTWYGSMNGDCLRLAGICFIILIVRLRVAASSASCRWRLKE